MKPEKSSLVSSFAAKLFAGDDGSESSSDEDFVCDEDQYSNSDESSETNSDESEQGSSEEIESQNASESNEFDFEPVKEEPIKKVVLQNSKVPKLPKINNFNICCVCLNDESDSFDELVSCDSCGFFTHEGCYGINDTESKQSTSSTASTEPWFCNSCLIEDRFEPNIKDHKGLRCFNRNCELCPNTNCGLLKETENGKFVHIVCALYTTGIAYQWPDRLWPVVLNEIPITNWGEHICSLCDNIRYSRTGICIKCDAGMCKNYFHVTCAQKHGLLVDPFQQQNTSDPFIAYCKTHNDSNVIKSRKASYYAMIASYKSKNLIDMRLFESETDENKKRLVLKFKRAIENYELDREKMVTKPSSTNRTRLLTTCPQILKCLLSKNKLNNSENLNIDQQVHSSSSVTFTVDFVKHFFERETKIPEYIRELECLKKSQLELTEEEAVLRSKYESSLQERQKLVVIRDDLIKKFQIYSNLLEQVLPKIDYPEEFFKKIFNTESKDKGLKPLIKTEAGEEIIYTKKSSKGRAKKLIKNESRINGLNLDACCIVCYQKTNSHLLIDCDTCKNVYHITCLEPPLSSVPKKTKLYGWECAKCVMKKEESENEEEIKKDIENEIEFNKRPVRERKQRVPSGSEKSEPKKRLKKNNSDVNLKVNKKEENNQTIKFDDNSNSIVELKTKERSLTSHNNSNNDNNVCSDSEAIFIHDEETESPKCKINPSIMLDNDSRAFKTLPLKSINEPGSPKKDSTKASQKSKKSRQSSNDEIENSNKRARSLSQTKSQDSLDAIIESVIKSPNIQPSRKHKLNKKNKL